MSKLLKVCHDAKYLPTTYTIFVRWATKPRWVPTAKTKKFYVHPRLQHQEGEYVEIRRLYNNYRTNMKGAIELIKELHKKNETSQEAIDKQELEKERLWNEAMKLNEQWNREVAVEREQWQRDNLEEQIRLAKEEMALKDEKKRLEQERIDEAIREQKELSATFITAEMLDAHVEKILNEPPHTFNYALDLKNNVYDGLSMYPTRCINEEGKFVPIESVPRTSRERGLVDRYRRDY